MLQYIFESNYLRNMIIKFKNAIYGRYWDSTINIESFTVNFVIKSGKQEYDFFNRILIYNLFSGRVTRGEKI